MYVPAVLKLFKHVYTERMEIEKALKIAFVSQQARVSYMRDKMLLSLHDVLHMLTISSVQN